MVLLGTVHLNLALTADGVAGMKYKSTDGIQESAEGRFHGLFSAAHHKGAAKMLNCQGGATVVLAVEIIQK